MSNTGLSESAHQLVADKGVDAVVEEAAAGASTHGAAASAQTPNSSASATAGESSSKTEKLIQDIKTPLNQMKGCGTIVVLFACCVVVISSTLLQWNISNVESLQRQEMYERIQLLNLDQIKLSNTCNEIILQLENIKTGVDSVEETVESVEETVEDTRDIQVIPLPIEP